MNMIEILESIKADIDDDDLNEIEYHDHGYLRCFIPENKRTLFAHLKDRKSIENLGDVLLMMLYSDDSSSGIDIFSDDYKYAIDEMEKYLITTEELYGYIEYQLQDDKLFKKTKRVKVLERYNIPFFISVTKELEIRTRDKMLKRYEGK